MKKLLLIAAVALTALEGCSNQTTTIAPKAVRVKVLAIDSISSSITLHYIGSIEEKSQTMISFAVAGTVEKLYVKEGDYVTKGAKIAEIDRRNLTQQYAMAEATFNQAKDGLKRVELMYKEESLPEVKYIEAQTRLEQTRSAYEIASKNLQDALIQAPGSGIIGQKFVEIGENVLPSRPIYSLLDVKEVMAKISVPENEMRYLSVNKEVTINFPMLEESVKGRISEKGIIGNPATHTYQVKVCIENKDHKFLPGMLCEADIQEDTEPSTILPCNAVQLSNHGQSFVWLVKEGKAHRTPVVAKGLAAEGIYIKEGLQAGDLVIVEGMNKVSENQEVSYDE